MVAINFAALRVHHLKGARYERCRAQWYAARGDYSRELLCRELARCHDASADDALMGMRNSDEPKARKRCN